MSLTTKLTYAQPSSRFVLVSFSGCQKRQNTYTMDMYVSSDPSGNTSTFPLPLFCLSGSSPDISLSSSAAQVQNALSSSGAPAQGVVSGSTVSPSGSSGVPIGVIIGIVVGVVVVVVIIIIIIVVVVVTRKKKAEASYGLIM
jgi:hypothetical protein